MRFFSGPVSFVLACCVLGACTTKHLPTSSATAHVAASPPTLAVNLTSLSGTVKLIGNNGAGIVSNNGSGIISNNSLGIVSNNSAGLVSNNGGGVTAASGSHFKLLAVAVSESLLSDAPVGVFDVAGNPILNAAGKPLAGTTDKNGAYVINGALPAKNLVLKVTLENGGELSAMLLASTGAHISQSIDTASSLGAAYVLGNYVNGSQATFEKLPADEAAKLQTGMEQARALLTGPPTYKPAALTQLVDVLRPRVPAVDKTLDEIKALLLGATKLGEGRVAATIPIYRPSGLAIDKTGLYYFGEPTQGRVRSVAPDGTLSTFLDGVRGKIKHNLPGFEDFVRAADGTFYFAEPSDGSCYVYELDPTGNVTAIAGTGRRDDAALAAPGAGSTTSLRPSRLALAPDGTLYIGEGYTEHTQVAPRVLARDAQGNLQPVVIDAGWSAAGWVGGLATLPDGTLYVLYGDNESQTGVLYKLPPGGKAVRVAEGFGFASFKDGDLACGPDGTVYVSETSPGRVTAIDSAGTRRVVAGAGGPAATQALQAPRSLGIAPDGTLLVADYAAGLVYALGTGGAWSVSAGSTKADQGADPSRLAFDAPVGAVFDDRGNLIVAEVGSNSLIRFDGQAFKTIAGGIQGFGGDGGPATEAKLDGPNAVAYHNGTLYLVDGRNERIRAIGPDGNIRTLVGESDSLADKNLPEGNSVPAAHWAVVAEAIAIGPDGLPYWTDDNARVMRLTADGGTVQRVAGAGHDTTNEFPNTPFDPAIGASGTATLAALIQPLGLAFAPDGSLAVADAASEVVSRISFKAGDSTTLDPVVGLPLAQVITLPAPGNIPDGTPANSVALYAPVSVAYDNYGNLLVAEIGTTAIPMFLSVTAGPAAQAFQGLPRTYAQILKISPDGKLTTIAGPGGKFLTDPTAEDGLIIPTGLAVAPDGRLAIIDSAANLVHIIPAGAY